MAIYILMNSGGQYYDFFDHTWNDLLEDCIAPFITLHTLRRLQNTMPVLYNASTPHYLGNL